MWQPAYSHCSRRFTLPSPQGPPSEGQLRYLEQLGHEGAMPATRADATDLIDHLKAAQPGQQRDRMDPQVGRRCCCLGAGEWQWNSMGGVGKFRRRHD